VKPLPISIEGKETHRPIEPWVSPTREKEELVRIWRVASRTLLQTKTLRVTGFFNIASSSCQFVCIEHRMSMQLMTFLWAFGASRPSSLRWFKVCEVQIEPSKLRRMVWGMTFLAFKRLQKTSCCVIEAYNWCPGRVSSQYLISTTCIPLFLILSSWALRTSPLGCLGCDTCDTWCIWGVVGDLNFLASKATDTHIFSTFSPFSLDPKEKWKITVTHEKFSNPNIFSLFNPNPQSALFTFFALGGGLRRPPARVPIVQDP